MADNTFSTSDDASFSRKLSEKMEEVGFRTSNAHIQSAMASTVEDMLRFLTKTGDLFVFGSYSDGLGSCLAKLDGSVEDSSDIDVTIFCHSVQRMPFHLIDDVTNKPGVCEFSEHCLPTEYKDGHALLTSGANAPNFPLGDETISIFSTFDIIFALHCCCYPRVEIVQPGYRNRKGESSQMSELILRALREEVSGGKPRCHVVVTSPPNADAGTHMRVSTTLLERIVMRNLSTIQCQLFIIIKFLIKRLISSKSSGIKTYVAKSLLFYMLDETPKENWLPQNLLNLVRDSLNMLIEMMNSFDSDDVCMQHFFLRDAAVYFKSGHEPKAAIVRVVKDVLQNLHSELNGFVSSLSRFAVTSVQFHSIFGLLLLVEMSESSHDKEQVMNAFHCALDTHAKVTEHFAANSSDEHLELLLTDIAAIPDCTRVSREWLRALAYLKVGKSLEEPGEPFEFSICRGIACPPLAKELSYDEAKEAVQLMLMNVVEN